MDKEFSKRLKKLTPDGGALDLTFSAGSSQQSGKILSTLTLQVLIPAEKGMSVSRRISLAANGNDITEANVRALEDVLALCGV